jgi:chromosome segregation ATPase
VPIIKEWRDNASPAEIVQEIPAAAQTAANQAAALIWKIATEHQAEAINAIRQESARIEQEAIAERDEALNEIKELEEQLRITKYALDTFKAESQAQLATAKQEGENARIAEQSCQARLEAASREIDGLKSQIKEERAAAQAELGSAKKEGENARIAELSSNAKLEAVTHDVKRLEAENEKATAKATEQASELTELRIKLKLTEATRQKAEEATKALRIELESVQKDKAKLEGMLTVYESIGKPVEAEPTKTTPRKTKQV